VTLVPVSDQPGLGDPAASKPGRRRRHQPADELTLILDGALSLVEAWSLHRRYAWGRWLVVGATSGLLPLELAAMIRHPTRVGAAVILLNAAVVLFLLARPRAFRG